MVAAACSKYGGQGRCKGKMKSDSSASSTQICYCGEKLDRCSHWGVGGSPTRIFEKMEQHKRIFKTGFCH